VGEQGEEQVEEQEVHRIDTKARLMLLHQTKHNPAPILPRTVPGNIQGNDIHFRQCLPPSFVPQLAFVTTKPHPKHSLRKSKQQ